MFAHIKMRLVFFRNRWLGHPPEMPLQRPEARALHAARAEEEAQIIARSLRMSGKVPNMPSQKGNMPFPGPTIG